jgi:hypothetical protein
MKIVAGLAMLLLACGTANAAPLPRYGIFYFSSVCYELESGDSAGNEAILIRTRDGDTLLWSWSEGPMEAPVPAFHLTMDGKGHIAFTVDMGPANGSQQELHPYAGTVSSSALQLGKTRLPRITDFATKIKVCR